MPRLSKLVAALLAAFALAAGAPASAHATGDNNAVAINTKDGSRVAKLAFAIRHVAGDVVDEQNAAVSFASCTDCQTIAIAIEIVLVQGSPSVVTPTNVALAINQSCTLCTTAALAYQFVVGTGSPVKFTGEGLRELAQIRHELETLRTEFEKGAIGLDELTARVDVLIERLKQVLETELIPIDEPAATGRGPPTVTTNTSTTETTETTTAPTETTPTTETGTSPTTTTTETEPVPPTTTTETTTTTP